MAYLKFIEGLNVSPFSDFYGVRDHEVPNLPGVYVLAATDNILYRYPSGRSPIFYIGQAKSLRRRLGLHIKYAIEAFEDRRLPLYWPRYEYAAAHGCRYCYIRTWQGMRPKSLEDIVLARFAKRYASFPVANGAGAWKRVQSEMAGC